MTAPEPQIVDVDLRVEDLRRAAAAAVDPVVRATIRVELADLLRTRGEAAGAIDQLRHAVADAPDARTVRLGVASIARSLPPGERAGLLISVSAGCAAGTAAPLLDQAADAYAESGRGDDAVRLWLDLARDRRIGLPRRRAAARRAQELAERQTAERAAESSRDLVEILRVRAGLMSGAVRRRLLARALGCAQALQVPGRVALAREWLEAGGDSAHVAQILAQADGDVRGRTSLAAVGPPDGPAPSPAVPPQASPSPAAAASVLAGEAARSEPAPEGDVLAAAVRDAEAGRSRRARRLAEEALRRGASGPEVSTALAAIDTALRGRGAVKDALLLRRVSLELALPDQDAAHRAALEALASDAEAAGLSALAACWRADGRRPTARRELPEPVPVTPAELYVAAQRAWIALPRTADPEPVLALLRRALAGHPGADEALGFADRLFEERPEPERDEARIELLRIASAAETAPDRKLRLADRLSVILEGRGDQMGALRVLEQALAVQTSAVSAPLRKRRARLLRALGRKRELMVALEVDADVLSGRERLAALVERADLLDEAGAADDALEVRLEAVRQFPHEVPVLSAARRRLHETGRIDDWLRLALAAVPRVPDRDGKRALLRDIAHLAETAGGDLRRAANAWLSIVELEPDDGEALDSAERLLLASAGWERCAELLAWRAARQEARGEPPAARAAVLWRLAELCRGQLGRPDEARRLYGQLARVSNGPPPGLPGAVLPTQVRRHPGYVLQTARAAAAPGPVERAQALTDRALVLLDEHARPAEAERDLALALELDPRNVQIIDALERVTEKTEQWGALRTRLTDKAAGLAPQAAARLWYGVGRASERCGDLDAAREAYARSMSLDPALAPPVSALRKVTARRGDPRELARLLELEAKLASRPVERGGLLIELASIVGEQLDDPARAVTLLDEAARLSTDPARTLDLSFRFQLAADPRGWEKANAVLEQLIATGTAVPDLADRYFRLGVAAETNGDLERALVFFSRAYSRNPSHRATLERLSDICFVQQQWDNAWRATEALLDRHGATLDMPRRAELLVRSALCDLHVFQRAAALARVSAMVRPAPHSDFDDGIRDVAESWASMRVEPRLAVAPDGERRERLIGRLERALDLLEGQTHPARAQALQVFGALAMIEARWSEAVSRLEHLADDATFSAKERAGFLIAAGDVCASKQRDAAAARAYYDRARALAPKDSRLAEPARSAPVESGPAA